MPRFYNLAPDVRTKILTAGQSACWLTDLLTRSVRMGRLDETPATLAEAFAWSVRRAEICETWKARVVWLIIQRQQARYGSPSLTATANALPNRDCQ